MMIKRALDDLLHLNRYDTAYLKRITLLQEGFVCKNNDHILFFGGTLTGVHVVRFTDHDREKFFDILVGKDQSYVDEVLYSLRTVDPHGVSVPVITREHVRFSDTYNVCTIYLIYRLHNTPHMDDNQREQAKIRTMCLLLYKFLTSLLYWYFQYPADPAVAQYTYEQLSRKFSLKQYGSWGATLWALAEKITGEESVHLSTITDMNDDAQVEKYINDAQSRVKDMLKNIYAVFMRVHEQGNRISAIAALMEGEDGTSIKDITSDLSSYVRYLQKVVPDQNSFIRSELLTVVYDMVHTAPPKMVVSTLEWISKDYLGKSSTKVEHLLHGVMEHAIVFLIENRDISKNDLNTVLTRLRGSYMSSRSTDQKLIRLRKEMEDLVELATESNNANAVSATRTACMLYIVARALTMRHFS